VCECISKKPDRSQPNPSSSNYRVFIEGLGAWQLIRTRVDDGAEYLLFRRGGISGTHRSVENDAQDYTRAVMQHHERLLKLNMGLAGNDAQEMARLEATGAAIKAKYAPGRVPSAVGSAFDKRVRALSSEIVAPARKGGWWMCSPNQPR
jgi:hypothetical protein